MSRWRPGPWVQAFNRMIDSLGMAKKSRTVVGRDSFGNLYYEEEAVSQEKPVLRGYIPGDQTNWQRLPPEWEAWLRGRRKQPPKEEEIAENEKAYALRMQRIEALGRGENQQRLASQAPRTEDAVGEKAKYPNIDTSSATEQASHRPFPRYGEFEELPGADKQENFRTDSKKD